MLNEIKKKDLLLWQLAEIGFYFFMFILFQVTKMLLFF